MQIEWVQNGIYACGRRRTPWLRMRLRQRQRQGQRQRQALRLGIGTLAWTVDALPNLLAVRQHFGQFYLIRPCNLFIFAAELFYSCLKNITSSSALWRESGIKDNCYGYALIPFRWYIFYCYKTLQKGIVNLVKFATHLRRHLLLYKVGVSTKDSNLPCLSVHVSVSRNAHKSWSFSSK